MTEADISPEFVNLSDTLVMEAKIASIERSIAAEQSMINNARVIQAALDEEDDAEKKVSIECLHPAFDLGGFFMDEENSSPHYRAALYVGPEGGDAIQGKVLGIVSRSLGEVDEGRGLQLMLAVGNFFDEIVFFDADKIIKGCKIDRVS